MSKKSGKELDPTTLQMMIGGHTILVDNGKATSFSRNVNSIGGSRARTAVGYSKDGRYAYLIATESNDNSKGMTLQQLQDFMTKIGVWKGMNLDGGGSTTMVNRPLAETNTELYLQHGIWHDAAQHCKLAWGVLNGTQGQLERSDGKRKQHPAHRADGYV